MPHQRLKPTCDRRLSDRSFASLWSAYSRTVSPRKAPPSAGGRTRREEPHGSRRYVLKGLRPAILLLALAAPASAADLPLSPPDADLLCRAMAGTTAALSVRTTDGGWLLMCPTRVRGVGYRRVEAGDAGTLAALATAVRKGGGR